jgi:DNA-binding transcriptional regulator YiaG
MNHDSANTSSSVHGQPEEPSMESPRRIQELRARTGLTQEKFAARLGVTFPTINRWENGRSKPSPLAIRQLQNLANDLDQADKSTQ